MATEKSLFTLLLTCLSIFSSALFASDLKSENHQTITPYETLFNAAIQGDALTLKTGLDLALNSNEVLSNFQHQQLTIMLGIINEKTDDTIDLLEQFTDENSKNPEALLFAGTAWKQLSKQGSFFSYFKTIKKGLNAHILAFELSPDNDFYRSLAGSSYTQIDIDNKPKQRALLADYKTPNSGFHLVALMDMAQNDRKNSLLLKLAEKVLNSTEDNLIVIERAAQAFWTGDDIKRAQQMFFKACFLPAPNNMYRYTWQNSCYLAGHLTLNETKEYQLGIDALTHLLSINKLSTPFNNDAKEMKADLLKKAKMVTSS